MDNASSSADISQGNASLAEDTEEQTTMVIKRPTDALLLQSTPQTHQLTKGKIRKDLLGLVCRTVCIATGHPVPLL